VDKENWSSWKLHSLQDKNNRDIKTYFFTCSWVIGAWQNFNIIWIAISLTPKPLIWEQIIWGILEPPNVFQDSNNPFLFNIETPWELF
jgi:hypothetical protein